MPVYEYRCSKCGDFEKEQSIKDDPLKTCPTCGGPVKRLISHNVGLVFKGSGFHITDYVHKDEKKQSKTASEGENANKDSDFKAEKKAS
ncbi:FmdB family zinc ribbon protein [Thermoanaerobacterium sp. DL9XJH110]|uniref:FmdB family zinc ribbon protein n=1 Tax=Thermoanaerobacterium sp. DL9XJH110 TaxID=3386643 RepID=UPI003BB591EF